MVVSVKWVKTVRHLSCRWCHCLLTKCLEYLPHAWTFPPHRCPPTSYPLFRNVSPSLKPRSNDPSSVKPSFIPQPATASLSCSDSEACHGHSCHGGGFWKAGFVANCPVFSDPRDGGVTVQGLDVTQVILYLKAGSATCCVALSKWPPPVPLFLHLPSGDQSIGLS